MNADNYVLSGEKIEKVLKKMEKEGYIVRVRERDGGGEETVEFVAGPRGKAEVGEKGVAGLVRKVWGKMGTEKEELERRLVRSLGEGVELKRGRTAGEGDEEEDGEGEIQEDGGEEDEVEEERSQTAARRRSRRQTSTPGRRANGGSGRSALVEDEADGDEEEEEEGEEEEGEEEEEVDEEDSDEE